MRTLLILVGATLSLLNLILGPTPFATRLFSVLIIALVVPFEYYGMRWILRLQISQHGLRRWITSFATFCFYFFGVGAVLSLAVLLINIGRRAPFALAVIAPAVFSYAAVDTMRREEHDNRDEQPAG